MAQKRIFIRRTQGEIDAINKRVSELGKDMNMYLRSEICKLNKKFEECPESVTPATGKKDQFSFYVSEYSYNTLNRIAVKMQRPISTVFDELLISPLLRPETTSAL
jgi:hypothetical protein